MKNKRILSLTLACIMVLALAIPSFAADSSDDEETNMTTVINGTYKKSVIAVSVPSTNTAFLNPYGIGITATGASGSVAIAGQIVSTPDCISNESNFDLQIGATVTGEIPLASGVTSTNAMKFATATTKGVGDDPEAEGYIAPLSTKSAYVKLELVAGGAGVLDSGDIDNTKVVDVFADEDTWASANGVVVGTKAVTEENLITIGKANMDSSGDFDTYANDSVVLYRLTGDCVVSPKVPWADTDTFTVTVAYTFTPVLGN